MRDPFNRFIHADEVPDGEVVHWDPHTGTKVTKYQIDANSYALKREYYMEEALLAKNAEDRADSHNTGWGDGRIIGRIPSHLLMDRDTAVSQATRAGDQKFVKKFFEENPKLKIRDKI